jgi:signal transduction histidine kinase
MAVDFSEYLKKPEMWDAAIIMTAAVVLLINIAGLLAKVTVVLPHLLYIPVFAAAYRYPRWGLLFAALIGAAYLLIVAAIVGLSSAILPEAVARVAILILLGWLVATLTARLRERESLYAGLFEHSEAGSILIRNTPSGRIIEDVNWSAATVLHSRPSRLQGSPLRSILSVEQEENLFLRLDGNRTVYAEEVTVQVPGNNPVHVLLSAASLPDRRVILTFVDITKRVHAESALVTANEKLSLLSRISSDHVQSLIDRVQHNVMKGLSSTGDAGVKKYFEHIHVLAENLTRQLSLAKSYHNLGRSPPEWIAVQQVLGSMILPEAPSPVSVRFWAERLSVYADPLVTDVIGHIVENSVRHGKTTHTIIVTYHLGKDGLDLVFRDDGPGVPSDKKEAIFEYDASGESGIGLFICRQILAVTGMTIREIGEEGKGACFVIHVPPEGYRIEGSSTETPAAVAGSSVKPGLNHHSGVMVRELVSSEFPRAHTIWIDYHHTTTDPATDRVFAAFRNGDIVALGRCKQHPDGYEVDGIFTPAQNRGHGYADAVVQGLVEACRHDTLYMHSVRNLVRFYGNHGFVPIPETDLPPTIKERYAWAVGNMEGADVAPMKRSPEPC